MKIPNKVYDVLKWIAVVCIPAVTTFLGVTLKVLNVNPDIVNIVLTILPAFGVLIGSLIGISTYQYNKENDK